MGGMYGGLYGGLYGYGMPYYGGMWGMGYPLYGMGMPFYGGYGKWWCHVFMSKHEIIIAEKKITTKHLHLNLS